MEYDVVSSITAEAFKTAYETHKTNVFDMRRESEFLSEHILDAHNTPLNFINDYLAEFKSNQPFFIHCAGGYRSMIAASILKSRGIHNLINIKGGFSAIKETSIQVSDFVCPSTL